jgi:hypothetical protein
MNELRIDSFGRRRVSPFDGSSGLVVVPDVTKDFSSEIVEGGKNAAGDDLSLDLGEPDFDLVKPRRIGGCKMEADLGMTGQEIVDELRFMSREIVGNHVDIAPEGLGSDNLSKKVNEVRGGMALGGLAKDFSAAGIQGRIQRQSAVTVILKAMSLSSARGKGQDGIQAVQGLDSALFVDAKDGGMIRWVQIKADNVGRLLLEIRIIAQHVTAQSVRLKAVSCPNSRNGHVIGAQHRGQPAAAPVGGSLLRATAGPFQNARLKLRGMRAHFATLMTGHQPCQSSGQKTLSPALDIRGTTPKHPGDSTHPKPRAQCKNNSGAPGILCADRSRSNAPTQFSAFRRTNHTFLLLHSLTMRHLVSHINVTLH